MTPEKPNAPYPVMFQVASHFADTHPKWLNLCTVNDKAQFQRMRQILEKLRIEYQVSTTPKG